MKLVYRWNSQLIFSGTDYVDDDYQLTGNETFDPVPQPNLIPIKRIGNAWQSATQAEHEAYVKAQQPAVSQPQEPTDQQKLNATTSLQLAQMMADNKKQSQFNAQLTIDVANLKKQLQDKTTAQATA